MQKKSEKFSTNFTFWEDLKKSFKLILRFLTTGFIFMQKIGNILNVNFS